MAPNRPLTPTYALRFEQDRSGSGLPIFRGTIIEITPDRDLGWQNAEAREYNDLELSCHGMEKSWENDARDTGFFEVTYKPYHVELADAEAMVSTLRKIERGMEKLRERFGRPETFGAYCEQVCLTLKIGCMATYSREAGLKIMPVGMGAALIDRTIDTWKAGRAA